MQVTFKGVLFVLIQLLLFIAYQFDIKWFDFLLPEIATTSGIFSAIIGGIIITIAILQLNYHLSPFPMPVNGSKLIVNGVYTYVRHPIYTGILIAFFGYAIYRSSEYKIIITSLLLILFYSKSKYEENLLRDMFPSYQAYVEKTHRFFPWIL